MAKPVSFRLDGRAFDSRQLTSIERIVARYLDALPFGDLISSINLANATGTSHTTTRKNRDKLTAYWTARRGAGGHPAMIWGSKKTIAELKRRIGHEN